MKRGFQASIPRACALELHSNQPEKLVQFYEEALGVKFRATTYPFRRYYANLGRFGLVIGDARGRDAETASEPEKATLVLVSPKDISAAERRFFLHHARPLGDAIPERLAVRLRDPDGNYIALAPSLEKLIGQRPAFSSLGELLGSVKQVMLLWVSHMGIRLRLWIEGGIDRCEMTINRVSFMRRDLRGYTHFVATRTGLYAVNSTSSKRMLRGRFFGITVKDGDLYAFQAMAEDQDNINKRGRVIRLTIKNDRIETVDVVAKDLDSECHQIDFVGDDLLIVDCFNCCILQMRPGSQEEPKAHYPLGNISRAAAGEQYHMNSIAGHPDGTVWVLLHNGGDKCSEVIVLDKQFEIIRRFSVDAAGAHNIVFTNDETEYLIADSSGGRVISPKGVVIDGGSGMWMLRGLSLDANIGVVGDSVFSARFFRRFVSGRIHFFDRRSWKLENSLSMPGAPMDIRRIDGKDLSISNYCAAQMQTAGISPESVSEPQAQPEAVT